MRNYIYQQATLFILLLCFAATGVRADHIFTADVSYVCSGGSSYDLELVIYQDCMQGNPPLTASLDLSSDNCNEDLSATLTRPLLGSGEDVSPLCDPSWGSCSGGTEIGVRKWVYSGSVTLPQQCTDWEISWTHAFRHDSLTTVEDPGNTVFYIQETLDNTQGCHDAVGYTSMPVVSACAGQEICFVPGAYNLGADSLRFALVPAQSDSEPVTYKNGYAGQMPLTSSGGLDFDPESGMVCFTPDTPQTGPMVFEVTAYRDGAVPGRSYREVYFTVATCSGNQIPQPDSVGITNVNNAVKIDAHTLQTCPGQNLSFDLDVSDADGDNLTITANNDESIPGTGSFTVSGNTATFDWTPADTGKFLLTIRMEDDNCPVLGVNYFPVKLHILAAGTQIQADRTTYCPSGDSLQLQAVGGTEFVWTPASGLSCDSCAAPRVSVSSTTQYTVTSNLPCDNQADIVITPVADFSVTAESDTFLCDESETVPLEANVASSVPNSYTYSWSPEEGLSSPNTSTTQASPEHTTVYTVTVASDSGCVVQDQVLVDASAVPQVTAWSAEETICFGDTMQLVGAVIPAGGDCDACDENPGGCATPVSDKTVGTGTGSNTGTTYPTPFGNWYWSNREQFLYRASELDAEGMECGTITQIAWNVANVNSCPALNNFVISMGCTGNTTMSSSFESGLTTVYGPVTYTPTSGWNTITLDVPYNWDGQSNLIVEVCSQNSNYVSNGNASVYWTNTGFTSSLYYYADNSTVCSNATGTTSSNRPNTRFTTCESPPDDTTPPPPPVYTWEPGDLIVGPNGTTDSITYAVPKADTTFTLYGSIAGCTATEQVSVEVDSTHVRTTPLTDTTICAGDSIPLSASVIGSFSAGSSQSNVGPADNNIGGGGGFSSPTFQWLIFDVMQECVLDFVAVYPQSSGTVGVRLLDNGGNVLQTTTVSVTVSSAYERVVIPVGFTLSPGTNYHMDAGGTTMNIYRNSSGGSYPYTMPEGWVTITGNSFAPAYYYFFYDWQLSKGGAVSAATCLIMEETFDGNINPNNWSAVNNGTVDSLCGAYSGNTALQFSGSGMRHATTRALEVSQGGFVEFYLKISQGTAACSGCNKTDNGEGVVLECSVDGGSSWIPMEDYAYDSSPEFTFYTASIPDTAHTDTTYLRWRQKAHSGTCNDNWALDEVRVLGPGECALSWYPHASLSDSVGTPYAFPTQSTTYEVTYNSDPKICRYTDTVRVNVEGPEVSLDGVEAATCGADNGSASVTATGGVSPYDYQWNDSNNQTTPTASGLAPGTYQVSVTDAAGCQNTLTVTVGSIPALKVSVDAVEEPTCPTSADGAAYISVSEGTSPYSYEWTTGDQEDHIEDVVTSTYYVTVTDDEGCEVTQKVKVTGPAPFSVTAGGQAPSSPSAKDGVAWVQVSGGTFPYKQIQWNDEAQQTGDTAKNLGVGTYTVRITDANDCVTEAQVELSMTTGVQQISRERSLTFYPNPAAHTLHVEYAQSEPQPVSIRLVNALGQVMLAQDFEATGEISEALDISDLSSGLYFLQLKPEREAALLRKVVIQNR